MYEQPEQASWRWTCLSQSKAIATKCNFTPFLHKIHFFINMMAFSPRILNYFFRTLLKSKLWILVFKDSNFPKKLIFVGGDRHHVTQTKTVGIFQERVKLWEYHLVVQHCLIWCPERPMAMPSRNTHRGGRGQVLLFWTGGTRHEINLRCVLFFCFLKDWGLKKIGLDFKGSHLFWGFAWETNKPKGSQIDHLTTGCKREACCLCLANVWTHPSSEKTPGCLGYIGDEILPKYKDPY